MIYWAALVTYLGYATGGLVLVYEARRRGLATRGMGLVAAAGFAGGLLAAKLGHWLLVDPALWSASPLSLFDPRLGGRTIITGILGGWLAVWATKRHLGITRPTGDLWALALPAGEAVGRFGCLLAGCCYGAECALPWAIWQHGAWRHPTQLYAAAWAALTWLVLWRSRGRLPREGDLFRLFLVLFGVGRWLIERHRAHDGGGSLELGQMGAVAIATLGVLSLWWVRRPR